MPSLLLPLLLTHSALAQSANPAATLPSELPVGYALDGDLTEWVGPPDLTLGGSAATPGVPAASPDDLSLRAWWVFTPDGLVIAADVRDDKVLLPGPGQDPMFSDHLALWVAGAAPDLPPVGFEHQFGLQIVRTPADCTTLEGVDKPDACKAWFSAQGPHRARLARLFLRQYVLAPSGVTEVWSGNCLADPAEDPPLGAAACKNSRIAMKPTERGYAVEALIALADLPATSGLPMTGLRLMLEAVDNDQGYDAQERLFSTAPTADPNRPETLPRYALPTPWFPDSDPPLFAALEERDPTTGMFFYPEKPLKTAYIFENLAQGYQYNPERPSPEVTALDWSSPRLVGTLGDLRVYQVAGQGRWCANCVADQRLVALRGGEIVGTQDLDDATVKLAVARGDALHLFLQTENAGTPLGTGACGACPHHQLAVMTMDAQGDFDSVFSDEILEQTATDQGGASYTYEGVTAFVAPDGGSLGFRGERSDKPDTTDMKPFVRTDRWDAAGGAYVEGADAAGR